jgi:two-component system alkaline phosphatase synthesis response regulator PhoP
MTYSKYTILLVDDEPDFLKELAAQLKKADFLVYTANTGKEAIALTLKVSPNIILLDVTMPQMDGIETCRELRSLDLAQKPIIAMLTARAEDYTQIAAFDAGADDFINKPIKARVLISRIGALLKRAASPSKDSLTAPTKNAIIIDRERYLVLKGSDEISLPKKEFELLALLATSPSKVFTREIILDRIWEGNIAEGGRTIDVHIRKLRQKLGNNVIVTIKGVGYKLEE